MDIPSIELNDIINNKIKVNSHNNEKVELLNTYVIIAIIISIILSFFACRQHQNIKEFIYISFVTSIIFFMVITSIHKNTYTVKNYIIIFIATLVGWLIGRKFRGLNIL